MNVQKALNILGININEVTVDNVKSVYRQRMKKVHPDAGGNEKEAKLVNEAYEILLKAADRLGKILGERGKSEGAYVITIKDVISIFGGTELNLSNPKGENIVLNKDNINLTFLIVLVGAEVNIKGQKICVDTTCVRDSKDSYNLSIDVADIEVFPDTDVEIIIADEVMRTKAFDKKVLIPVKLPYNVRVNLRFSFEQFKG